MKPENTLTTAELLRMLSVAAMELYAIGMADAEDEVSVLETAVHILASAYPEAEEDAPTALSLIERQRKLVAQCKNSQELELAIGVDELFHDPTGEQVLTILDKLLELLVPLHCQDDRDAIAVLMRYLVDFWQLRDCMQL